MIIAFGNYKGGVGKTTATELFSYILSTKMNYRVLAIDTDPQSNLSEILAKTFKTNLDEDKNIFNPCFKNQTTKENIQRLSDNLDILSGSWDMVNFEKEATTQYKKNGLNKILPTVLKEVQNKYDYILIDTAPSTDLIMENVLMAIDYIVVTTQSMPLSFSSTTKFYTYLLDFYHSDETNFDLLGVLPYLIGNSKTDKEMLEKYKLYFEDDLFKNMIKNSDRVKTWSEIGITEDKPYDKKTLEMYTHVVNEALNRIGR